MRSTAFRLIFANFKRKIGKEAKRSQPASGLLIVMFFAQRFPIGLIPKQSLIASVRDDVVDHSRGHNLSLCLAEDTQRMLLKE